MRYFLAFTLSCLFFFVFLFTHTSPAYAAVACHQGAKIIFSSDPLNTLVDSTVTITLDKTAAVGTECSDLTAGFYNPGSRAIAFCNKYSYCPSITDLLACGNGWNCSNGAISCQTNADGGITFSRTLAAGSLSQSGYWFRSVIPKTIGGDKSKITYDSICEGQFEAQEAGSGGSCGIDISLSTIPPVLNQDFSVTVGGLQTGEISALELIRDGGYKSIVGRATSDAPTVIIKASEFTADDKNKSHTILFNQAKSDSSYCAQAITFWLSDGKTKGPQDVSNNTFDLCAQIPPTLKSSNGKLAQASCADCSTKGGIWTSLGCIPTTGIGIITSVVKIGLSVAGGVALLMIIAASFMLSTSSGDQKRVEEARGLISSAVIGLLFIIFSVTMLQFIGVNILQIPGFGK